MFPSDALRSDTALPSQEVRGQVVPVQGPAAHGQVHSQAWTSSIGTPTLPTPGSQMLFPGPHAPLGLSGSQRRS